MKEVCAGIFGMLLMIVVGMAVLVVKIYILLWIIGWILS